MNDIRTNAPGMDALRSNAPADTGISQKTGSFKSAAVHVIDQASQIADAAEELTSELSEETEKDVSDREVEDGRKADSLQHLFEIGDIKELMKSLGDLDHRKLFRGLKALLESQSRDPGELRRHTQEQFKEPSHQYAALKSLVEALKARGAPKEQIEAAEQALSGLMDEHGPAIRAAINIGATAQSYEQSDLGAVPDLRDAYKTNIHNYTAIKGVLDDLVKRFGEQKLQNSINFMLKALASDLEAEGSSIDKTQLNLIMADMNRIKTMSTMLANCGFLMDNAKNMGAKESFTPVTLLKEIAPLLDAPRVQKDQIAAIPDHAGVSEIEHQIRFLNDLREVVRLIPIESYAQPESHDKLDDAIKDALVEKGDLEIELEEEGEDD